MTVSSGVGPPPAGVQLATTKMGRAPLRLGRPPTLRPPPNDRRMRPPPIRRMLLAMSDITRMASVAALLGDPARANILTALLDGRALTAKELAFAAHVTPQTASGHLAQLTDASLLAPRNRDVTAISAWPPRWSGRCWRASWRSPVRNRGRCNPWRGGDALRTARTCYDHLAGRLGVALADSLTEGGHVALTHDGGEVTEPRPRVPARLWRRTGGGQAGVLPPVPGLERAPPAHRRPAGRRAGDALPGPGLDRAPAGFARGDHHAGRHAWFRRDLRHPPGD